MAEIDVKLAKFGKPITDNKKVVKSKSAPSKKKKTTAKSK